MGCGGFWRGSDKGNGAYEAGGGDEADGVEDVAAFGSEVGDHEGSDGGADDAHAEHDLLDEGVGGAEAVERDGGTDGDSLGRGEEAGDDADEGENGVEVPDLVGDEKEEAEGRTDAVACDHGGLEWPAVDEDSGEDAEDRDGKHVGDLNAGDLLGGCVELEGEDSDNGEESEEVSEDGDGLGVPETAHHGDAHHVAHGERRGEFRVDGWLGYRLGCGRVGGGCAHAGCVYGTRTEMLPFHGSPALPPENKNGDYSQSAGAGGQRTPERI